MTLNILAFGIAREIVGGACIGLSVDHAIKVSELKTSLVQQFPGLQQLSSFVIAVNGEYAPAGQIIQPGDEVAIIPPVSGG